MSIDCEIFRGKNAHKNTDLFSFLTEMSMRERTTAAKAPRRILVVDDYRDSADSMAALLRLFGWDAQVSYDGRSAIAVVPNFQPQAVLLDIGMPDMDGYEVAEELRKLTSPTRLLLVAFTAWGGPRDVERARNAGFDFHLQKPCSIDRLVDVLTHAPESSEF